MAEIDEIIKEIQNKPKIERTDLLKSNNEIVKNIDELIEEVKNKQPDSLKRAKAKYYQRKKEDLAFIEAGRIRSRKYYEERKDDLEYKEHTRQYAKEYYKANNEKTKEYYKNYNYNKKLKEVTHKLEILGMDKLAEILISNKKLKLLDCYEILESD
jgi:hypothetical protein